MYTVFTEDGKVKHHLGLVCFVRTLSEARKHCTSPGEKIVHWSSSGYAKTTWVCQYNGRLKLVPKARR